MLDHGRVVEDGSHDELLEREGTYARLHKLQFGPVAKNGAKSAERNIKIAICQTSTKFSKARAIRDIVSLPVRDSHVFSNSSPTP